MARALPTFEPDSPLVDLVVPGRGYRRGKLLPRVGPAVAIVVHTAGGGVVARFKREGARKGDTDPFDTTLRVYRDLMDASPNYVVGQRGQRAQVVPEDLCAWHVGGAGSAPYWRSAWVPWRDAKRYAWWRERWPDLDSPRDLAGGGLWRPYIVPPTLGQRIRHPLSWGRGSANAWTKSIEVVPPLDDPNGPWSPACWRALAELVVDIAGRDEIHLEREYVFTHSDAHPLSRTTASGKPWDTVEQQWSWDAFMRS